MNTKFTQQLLNWHYNNPRELAWKSDTDAYSTWLSEIIMQQTRVAYGTKYYLKFKRLYPTVFDLAKAPQQEVLKAWEGLGYYSRARNLHATAKYVANELGGKFPIKSADLQKLKGIGVYTASAIASFVSNEKVAAIDGNAYRVFARYFGIYTPIDSTEGKKEFQALGNRVIDNDAPGAFNQAIMNLGALICTPKQPYCFNCPLNDSCYAFKNRSILELPVKEKSVKVKNRYFTYFIMKQNNATFITERTSKGVWQNLWEFPLIELDKPDISKALNLFSQNFNLQNLTVEKLFEIKKQRLSHQLIEIQFVLLKLEQPFDSTEFKKVPIENLAEYPFPKTIKDFLKNNVT